MKRYRALGFYKAIRGFYWGYLGVYIGIIEHNMETTT